MNNRINNGLEIKPIYEYCYSTYPCFINTVEFELKKYRIKTLENKISMT
jgi:hypothetical protein